MSGAVVKADWVVKSSGGKKEAASGAIEADRKESWKKRFLVLRAADSAGGAGGATLSWYKNDKAGLAGKSSQGDIVLESATCEVLSSVMGECIIEIHCKGVRDLRFKVAAEHADVWVRAVRGHGATEDEELAAIRLQAAMRRSDTRRTVVRDVVAKETGASAVTATGNGMILYVRAGPNGEPLGPCAFSHKVLMALALTAIKPTIRVPDADHSSAAYGIFRLLSLQGETPVLATADGDVFTDSETIIRYIDDRGTSAGAQSLFAPGNADLARAISPLHDTAMAWFWADYNAGPLLDMLETALEALNDIMGKRRRKGNFMLDTVLPSVIDCNIGPKLLHLKIIGDVFKAKWSIDKKLNHLLEYIELIESSAAFTSTMPTVDVITWGLKTAAKPCNTKIATKGATQHYINTSNNDKYREFEALFAVHSISLDRTSYDLKEIQADPEAVAAHKATSCGLNVIVEDTSLEVEGASVGVNVKQLLDDLDKHEGKNAIWRVLLAVLIEKNDRNRGKIETVYIYEGVQNGTIVAPRSLPGQQSFGFDPVFQPDGSRFTLAEEKPVAFSARAKAVEAFALDIRKCELEPIRDWEGPWQPED